MKLAAVYNSSAFNGAQPTAINLHTYTFIQQYWYRSCLVHSQNFKLLFLILHWQTRLLHFSSD